MALKSKARNRQAYAKLELKNGWMILSAAVSDDGDDVDSKRPSG